jgi:hypothetical protein
MTIEELYEPLRANAQTTLNAAGFSDVNVVVGYFQHNDHLRLEVRLNGPPNRVTEARKLLPFSDNPN